MVIDGVGCAEAQGQLLCVRVRGTGVGLQRGAAVIGGWGCVALCWESKQSLRLAENPASFSQAAGRSGQIASKGDGVPQAAKKVAGELPPGRGDEGVAIGRQTRSPAKMDSMDPNLASSIQKMSDKDKYSYPGDQPSLYTS